MTSYSDKLEEWFKDRHWRVMTELDGTVTDQGVSIVYGQGHFEIAPPGAFITPFGNRGRAGFIVQEDGADSRAAFGEAVLRRAQATYGTVAGLPEES